MKYSAQHEEELIKKIGPLLQLSKTISEICLILNKEGPWPKRSEIWTELNLIAWIRERKKHFQEKYPINFRIPPKKFQNHEEMTKWCLSNLPQWELLAKLWLQSVAQALEENMASALKEGFRTGLIDEIENILTRPENKNEIKQSADILRLFSSLQPVYK